MKKLLLLITLLSILSCKKAVTLEESEIDIQKEKLIRINGREWYLTTASDGHEYIDNSGYHDYMCMHYVDCKKCAKKLNTDN